MALPTASVIAGQPGTAISLGANSTDTSGEINITLASPGSSATLRVTFGYPFVKPVVIVSPSTEIGATNFPFLKVTKTTTYFDLDFQVAASGIECKYHYHVIDTQTSAAGLPLNLPSTGTGYTGGILQTGSTDVAGQLQFDPTGAGFANTCFKNAYSVPPITVFGPMEMDYGNMCYIWSGSGTTASGGSNQTALFSVNFSGSIFGSAAGGSAFQELGYQIIETQAANGGAPLAITAGPAGGIVSIFNCTDVAGNVSIRASGSSGIAATITFKSAYPVPPKVVFSACNENGALFTGYIFAYTTTTTLVFAMAAAPALAGLTGNFAFHVFQ